MEFNILNLIRKKESLPISDSDLRKIIGYDIPVVSYHDLPNYSRLEDIWGGRKQFILLMESRFNSGHFVSIIYSDLTNTIEFYDPYGNTHNTLIKKLNYYVSENGQYFLNNLFKQFQQMTNCRILYNRYVYQTSHDQIQTCGRHCAVRILFSQQNNVEYHRNLQQIKDQYSIPYDDMITMMTLFPVFH